MNLCRKSGLPAVFPVLLAVLLLASCGKKAEPEPVLPSDEPSDNMAVIIPSGREAEGSADTASSAPSGELGTISGLIDEGRYYEAFREILLYEEKHTDAESIEECEALYARLEPLVRENEPESGKELARSFRYYGGCLLEAVAESGPLLITVTDAGIPDDPSTLPQYSRFYVRKGESGAIHLPAGVYHVSYQVGYLWFDDEIGFGDYWNGGDLDRNLTFEVNANGSVTNNSKYTLTF